MREREILREKCERVLAQNFREKNTKAQPTRERKAETREGKKVTQIDKGVFTHHLNGQSRFKPESNFLRKYGWLLSNL
jgi:hypothetical protein